MNRSPGGLDSNPFAATLIDRAKRPLIAELIGQGFVVAYQTIVQNRQATERIADELIREGRAVRRRRDVAARRRGPAQARDRRPGRGDMAGDLIPPPSPPAARRRTRWPMFARPSSSKRRRTSPTTPGREGRADPVPRPLRVRVRRARGHRRLCGRARGRPDRVPRAATRARSPRTGRTGSPRRRGCCRAARTSPRTSHANTNSTPATSWRRSAAAASRSAGRRSASRCGRRAASSRCCADRGCCTC